MEPTLTEIETLARKAGEILRVGYNARPGMGNHLQVDYKGEIDLVTEIDHQSEAYILGEIRRSYPQDQIIAEESGQSGNSACCVWYIDPLDGTVNYAHGVPLFAVSIAYQSQGELKYGVVYNPILDECFSAEKGKGAWLNGKPIHVSNAQRAIDSLLVTGFPYDIRTNPENNLDHYADIIVRTQGVSRLGTAASDLCYVAAGRFDGFWELRLSPWDVAAGAIIVREAGGVVTDLQGKLDILTPSASILAANPHLHPQLLKILHNGCQPSS